MEQAKQNSILNAATKAFSKLGFRKASIDEIARAAGVAKGTIYLACESKEDLLYQVVHREVRTWVAEVARLIDPRVAADELLGRIAMAGIEYLNSHPLLRDLLFRDLHRVLPDWADRLDELRELGLANVVELVRLGVRQGRFRADLDAMQVAMGVSVLEDIVAVVMLTILSSLTGPLEGAVTNSVGSTLGLLGAFVVVAGVGGLLSIPWLLRKLSATAEQEQLTIVVAGLLFMLAIFAGRFLRFLILGLLTLKFGPTVVELGGKVVAHHFQWVLVAAAVGLIGWLIWRRQAGKNTEKQTQPRD